MNRPYIMLIAGFDPSAGAGILADVKTAEQCSAYGLGITTSITYQNDFEFMGLDRLPLENIIRQIDVLIGVYEPEWVKIGLVENLSVLDSIINYLLSIDEKIRIIWDPILKASAGFEFHEKIDKEKLSLILEKIYLLTPNIDEAKILFDFEDIDIEKIKNKLKDTECSVLLKSYQEDKYFIYDLLIDKDDDYLLGHQKMEAKSKHGTGCVLSSAITSFLANGYSLRESCTKAQDYIGRFIDSNELNLGYHKIESL